LELKEDTQLYYTNLYPGTAQETHIAEQPPRLFPEIIGLRDTSNIDFSLLYKCWCFSGAGALFAIV
jgi:hypothetical protein